MRLTNYNEELAQELAILRDKTKRGMLPLVIRNPTLEGATLRYVDGLESFMETRDNPPIALRNADLLHKAADIVLYEELTWSHPDKMSILEYPVMTESQSEERMARATPHSDLQYGDRRYNGRQKVHFTDDNGAPQVRNPRMVERNDLGIERLETQIIVHEALDNAGLTQRQRQAIELVYFENMTQEDAAKELGVSQQAIAKSERYALRKLRYYLTDINESYV